MRVVSRRKSTPAGGPGRVERGVCVVCVVCGACGVCELSGVCEVCVLASRRLF